MRKILSSDFFDRNSVLVARELLGKTLARKIDGAVLRFRIIETEAYEGTEDKASHAHRGLTPRNTPMFGEPGRVYIYFTYGMHWMLNLTCGKKGHPAAVLIRGIEGTVGPARLTKKLFIDKTLNGKKMGRSAGLWVESGEEVSPKLISKTPRIGIDSSGPIWSKKHYRFVLK